MAARFHHAFQDELTYFEQAKRGKATPQEARSILERLATTAVEHGIQKRVFLIGYADVPAEDRYQIYQAIRDSGGIPTEQRVVELFRRRLMARPPHTEMPPPPVRPGESEMRLQVEAGKDVERGHRRGASLPLDQRLPVPGIGPKPPESH